MTQSTAKYITLITGNCLDILPTIQEKSISLIIADPPYNVSKAGGRNGFRGKKFVDMTWDTVEDYSEFSDTWMEACRRVLKDNGTMYIWAYYRSIPLLPIHKWYPLNLIVWKKTNAFPTTMQNSIWSPSCEFAYFLRKNPGKGHTFHIGKEDFARDVFEQPVVNYPYHPTRKPISIISEMIRRSTNLGDTVLDPFLGSGTTAEASLSLGRKCIGIDINPEYIELANRNLESVPTRLEI